MSLRRRLIGSSLLTLLVGLGALLAVGNAFFAVRVRTETTSLLRARAQAQLAALTVTRDRVVVRDSVADEVLDRQSWVFEHGRVVERPTGVAPVLDQAAVALGSSTRTVERDGPRETRLRAVPAFADGATRPTGAVVVSLSVAAVERLQQEVLVGSFAFAALVLLAGALATRGAVDGALKPVARMTESAEGWGAHDLDGRFGLGPPRDELTALAATLDGLLARIAASRRHEQRFASEVAHELRTPVAGLRARAELALAPSASEGERTAALEAVVADAARLDATIDALLALARRELDPSDGVVDVGDVAAAFEGVAVEVAPGVPHAEGDPDTVRRALSPLVENARRHARSRVQLAVTAADGRVRVTVRDDGPGLDPALGEEAFEPGARGPGSDGAGLGLPLARRLARSCGGDVVTGPGPGGCFVLELPAVGS